MQGPQNVKITTFRVSLSRALRCHHLYRGAKHQIYEFQIANLKIYHIEVITIITTRTVKMTVL